MSGGARRLVLGQITSAFGIKGWVKVYSYTDPPANLFHHAHWDLKLPGRQEPVSVRLSEWKRHGKGFVARLEGYDDRNAVLGLRDAEVTLDARELPPLPEGEFYWYQLEGLPVVAREGTRLGFVHHLMETGSNDVMVVRPDSESLDGRERLIPYLPETVVHRVDLSVPVIEVDWDPEF